MLSSSSPSRANCMYCLVCIGICGEVLDSRPSRRNVSNRLQGQAKHVMYNRDEVNTKIVLSELDD